ncbi:MAG: alanyl-tRNA editing protein [Anaerolineae bacterium]|nr:alanyl-tRNA editing protein [Anaerolineae bacterium]
MTIRLYFQDSYLQSFEARVEASRHGQAGWEVALDRTGFYPEGGGQPSDRGTLGEACVAHVYEQDGQIWHVLTGAPPDGSVSAQIDWERRFDHMQQHTGQHLLSAVALGQLGAQTLSFHLGAESSTIDLDLAGLTDDVCHALEDEANRLVMASIPVRAYMVEPHDIPRLNLRKPPTKGEQTRVVEISGVDLSPCGGTHVRSTAEIGLIKVRRTERYKGGTRLEFLCGWRALRDYQWRHAAVSLLARELSVADRELIEAVHRLQAAEREARQEAEHARRELLIREAAALQQEAQQVGSLRVIARSFAARSAAEVKHLAGLLVARPGTVALLATQAPTARLFFVRSAEVELDMRELMRRVTGRFGGGGGGRPEAAEGGGMAAGAIREALAWAVGQLRSEVF